MLRVSVLKVTIISFALLLVIFAITFLAFILFPPYQTLQLNIYLFGYLLAIIYLIVECILLIYGVLRRNKAGANQAEKHAGTQIIWFAVLLGIFTVVMWWLVTFIIPAS